jgi:hypothetical protein
MALHNAEAGDDTAYGKNAGNKKRHRNDDEDGSAVFAEEHGHWICGGRSTEYEVAEHGQNQQAASLFMIGGASFRG